jgi:hypothetical protein
LSLGTRDGCPPTSARDRSSKKQSPASATSADGALVADVGRVPPPRHPRAKSQASRASRPRSNARMSTDSPTPPPGLQAHGSTARNRLTRSVITPKQRPQATALGLQNPVENELDGVLQDHPDEVVHPHPDDDHPRQGRNQQTKAGRSEPPAPRILSLIAENMAIKLTRTNPEGQHSSRPSESETRCERAVGRVISVTRGKVEILEHIYGAVLEPRRKNCNRSHLPVQ